ncbi:MAG: DNA recombination protein RmuC [Actinobacteria bacterium]|nr:DNA recombination protein RmuC [Actinomycetota bacterium]
MTVTTVVLVLVVAVLAAGAGAALAWVSATRRAEDQLQAARADGVRLQAILDSERTAAREREQRLERTDEQLRETFGALSNEALARNSEALLQLAETRLATARASAQGDLTERQQAIEALVTPMRESLTQVQQQLQSVERSRASSESALREHLTGMRQSSEQLRLETSALVTALRAPQVRGRWGELQLERTVEAAGMAEHVDYTTQVTATGPDGAVRPDLIVHLVGGKCVVVDSKVAFSAYLEAMEAADESVRAARFKAHARHLKAHIDSLAAKSYWEHFTPSPEFVVCFVPADAFLDAALREDPTLQEHAFAHNVILATPSTLIALLRTVAYTWRQEALARNAADVHRLGRELYQRLSTMGGHIDKLGRALGSAVGSYNQTVASLESRVFVAARRMTDLKVVEPGTALKTPDQLSETARTTQIPELAEQRVVSLAKPRGVIGQTDLLGAAELEVPRASGS